MKRCTALALALATLTVSNASHARGVVRLTSRQAVDRALRHNLELIRARLSPDLSGAARQIAESAFDPTLTSNFDVSGSPGSVSQQRAGLSPISSIEVGGGAGLRKDFSTGTSVEAKLSSFGLFGSGGSKGGLDPAYQSGVNLTARQSLLSGISRSANELAITAAQLTRSGAKKSLTRTAELIAVATLRAYWELHAALAKVAIQEVALKTSERTLAETIALIRAGKLPASEEVSASYAVQTQRRDLLQYTKEVANARDQLARLIGLVPASSTRTPEIVTVVGSKPKLPQLARADLQRFALRRRGDYLQLVEQLKIYRAERKAARHKRLPSLDLVAGLSLTGLSGTATDGSDDYPGGYWSSFGMKRVGWSAGLVFELPLFNRKAKAELELADLKLRRAKLAVDLAVQELSQELNVAWRAVEVARQQLRLTKVAMKVAETKLANETARFKAGKITAHILSTVQSEVVKEKLAKEQALADLIKARVEMYASAGILIQRLSQMKRRRR